eukprot:1650798-Pleurochrysis_carterae.AAC.1
MCFAEHRGALRFFEFCIVDGFRQQQGSPQRGFLLHTRDIVREVGGARREEESEAGGGGEVSTKRGGEGGRAQSSQRREERQESRRGRQKALRM